MRTWLFVFGRLEIRFWFEGSKYEGWLLLLGGEGFAKTVVRKSSNCGEAGLWPCWLLGRPLTRELGAFASVSGINCSVVEVLFVATPKIPLVV